MTKKRKDEHSTEFGLWIREQDSVDSYKGYRNYNLDVIWWKKKGFEKQPEMWMLIEEKRHMAECSKDQALTYTWLHNKIKLLNDETYKGIHLLQFEKTNPEDGKIYWDRKEVTKEQLIEILQFKKSS
jgi:protoporphyrinogen oxidase